MSAAKARAGKASGRGPKNRRSTAIPATVDGPVESTPAEIVGPFNLREYLLMGMGILYVLNSFLPTMSASAFGITLSYSVWTTPRMQILLVAVFVIFPVITSVLIALRRTMPTVNWRVGSLSIDQYASVASVVLSIIYLSTMFLLVIAIPLDSSIPPGAGLFSGLILSCVSIALTTGAYLIPGLRGEFANRPDVPAHPTARPLAQRGGRGLHTGSMALELPSAGPGRPRTGTIDIETPAETGPAPDAQPPTTRLSVAERKAEQKKLATAQRGGQDPAARPTAVIEPVEPEVTGGTGGAGSTGASGTTGASITGASVTGASVSGASASGSSAPGASGHTLSTDSFSGSGRPPQQAQAPRAAELQPEPEPIPEAPRPMPDHPSRFDAQLAPLATGGQVPQFGDSDEPIQDIPPAPPVRETNARPAPRFDTQTGARIEYDAPSFSPPGGHAAAEHAAPDYAAQHPAAQDHAAQDHAAPDYAARNHVDYAEVVKDAAFDATPDDVVMGEEVYDSFWIAVPDSRDVIDEETGGLVFVALPGEWILAIEDRGTSLMLRHEDGREGLLRDASDVHRA